MDDHIPQGLVSGTLSVNVLEEGVHSGDASGVVASSFRIIRMPSIESKMDSGALLLESLNVDIPRQRSAQAKAAAAILGTIVSERFPYVDGMKPVHQDRPELLLNRTWRPPSRTQASMGSHPYQMRETSFDQARLFS